ncbi:MAG: O-antigen ligase family protein, partial [Pirellulales bacterium]
MKSLIFTYLLTYGGSLVAVFNPYIGLLIYVLFAIVQPPVIWWYAVPVGNYARIIAVALLVGWVLQNTGSWSFGKAKVSVWLLVGFLFWMVLSTLFAASPDRASYFLEIQAKIVLPFIVGMTLIDTPAKLKQLAWVIAISTGYLGYELNLQWLDYPNRLYFHGFGALDNNGVAVTMVTGAAIAFFLGSEDDSIWRRWFAFILAGLQVHVILFSQSRGGMLALVIMAGVCAILLLIRPKVTRSLTYMGMALVIGMALAGPSVWERFNSIFVEPEERDASAVSRLELWTACYQLMLEEPLFGVGPNHFPAYA